MTTQELKQQIDKVLGNSIRCLLPSYWWKRVFGAVIDNTISKDEVKTINGESILGEGDLRVGVKSVESVEALEKLDAQVGDIATVGVESLEVVSVGNLYTSTFDDFSKDWDKLTRINKIELGEPVTGDEEYATVLLCKKGETALDNTIQIASENGTLFITHHYRDSDTSSVTTFISESKANELLKKDEYRLYFYSAYKTLNAVEVADMIVKLIVDHSSADAYIKSDSWEKLAKEYVVSSEEELNSLDAPVGSIARIAYDGNKKINLFECKVPSKQDNEESIIKNWDEYTRIAKIESAVPVGSDTSVLFLIKFFNPREDEPVASISFDKGTCIVTLISSNNGEQKVRNVSLEEFNKILLQKDYRLYNIDYTTEAAVVDLITNYMTFYGLPTVSDAYIKGETWTRLLKEGDVTGGGADITIDSELSDTSENPVQNKVVTEALGILEEHLAVHSKQISSLGLSMATKEELNNKADKSDIKTINGVSLLGGGDITISGGGVSEDYVNTAIAQAITNTLNTEV